METVHILIAVFVLYQDTTAKAESPIIPADERSCRQDICKDFAFTEESLKDGSLEEKLKSFVRQQLEMTASDDVTIQTHVNVGKEVKNKCEAVTTVSIKPTLTAMSISRGKLQSNKSVIEAQDCSFACLVNNCNNGIFNQPAEFSKIGVLASIPVDGVGSVPTNITVYCDCTIPGEIVFQRRVDDSVSFDRGMEEYQKGFGNWTGNFWLGLEKLHLLAASRRYKLSIKRKPHGSQSMMTTYYKSVQIGGMELNFAMTTDEYSVLSAKDVKFTNGWSFRIATSPNKCEGRSGWWFTGNHEYDCSLNGPYKRQGVKWFFSGDLKWLKAVEMRLTPIT